MSARLLCFFQFWVSPVKYQRGRTTFISDIVKILKDLSIEGHSMYGYKHTGAIQLYEQTLDIMAVSHHCRHSSTQQTEEYLRGYGVSTAEKILRFKAF